MNPDFLKKLAEITAALRSGLTANPLDELQKRATQFGEGVGYGLEHDRAQAGYAKAHPESARAQQEMFGNAAMMALQMGKGGEGEFIPKENAAALKLGRKVFTGQTHSNAIQAAQAEGALPSWSSPSFNALMQKAKEGFVTNTGRFLSREDAYDLQDAAGKLSGPVKAQIAERARHIPSLNNKSLDAVDVRKGLTAEDVKGTLYANRGTKADEPMTLDDLNRIMAKKNRGKASLDSVVSKLPAALQGKDFKNDVDKRIRGALFENALRAEKAAREAERASAAKANARDYGITKDDRAALKRGDLQRKTGIPMDSVVSLGSRLHEALTKNGGFTIDPETGADLTSGYSVGGGEKSGVLLKKPLADLKPNELESFLAANKNKLRPGQAWGGWVDNGQVYAEPADQVSDINEAQRLGNERGEKAIWDHANKAEIPLKAGRAEAASTKVDDFNAILGKWHTTLAGYRDLGKQLAEAPERHRAALLDAEQNPVTPSTPWLTKYTQQDIERPNGASPEKIGRVESMAYDAFTSPKFKKWLEAGHGTGNWYDTRKTQARAIVALGDKLGPQAFNEFIDHVAASTAMSRPENNIRRASWYRALNLQGMLNPDELRSSTLAAPEGMGHIANKAHHYATADLVQNGEVNKLANPKPASFGENLKMNWRPLTFDTRMANATLTAKPKMTLGLAGEKSDATPRKWAYAPIERAAQQAAAEAAKRGDLGDLPAGVDPTAAWQAQVWGGIGRTSKSHMMSVNNPSFHEILDRLLKRSAERWGVTPGKANELFWKGQPLDLPLDAKLVTGPSRVRKK